MEGRSRTDGYVKGATPFPSYTLSNLSIIISNILIAELCDPQD